MGIVHFCQIANQRLRDLPITELFAAFASAPGTRMHFINQHRTMIGIIVSPIFQPFLIAPDITQTRNFRRSVRTHLGSKSIGVTFEANFPGRTGNRVFI